MILLCYLISINMYWVVHFYNHQHIGVTSRSMDAQFYVANEKLVMGLVKVVSCLNWWSDFRATDIINQSHLH